MSFFYPTEKVTIGNGGREFERLAAKALLGDGVFEIEEVRIYASNIIVKLVGVGKEFNSVIFRKVKDADLHSSDKS